MAAAVLLFCVAEQIHVTAQRGLARADELARLDKVPMPPRECQAFLIDLPDEQDNVASVYAQPEAMWISMKTGLPTLNGISGNFPPHWETHAPWTLRQADARGRRAIGSSATT